MTHAESLLLKAAEALDKARTAEARGDKKSRARYLDQAEAYRRQALHRNTAA